MARKRRPERPKLTSYGVPAALAVGPCIEVWSGRTERGNPFRDPAQLAASRYGRAVDRWVAASGIDRAERFRLVPAMAPFSALDRPVPGDLAALRTEAAELLKG